MNFKTHFFFLFLLQCSFGTSQNITRIFIDVIVNDKTLINPTTGGLNAPQFSEPDLNNDGIKDLYIFDRVGNVHLTFLNDGTPNQSNYSFAPEYILNFPFCVNWAVLKDFNGDGAYDLFTHAGNEGIQGIRVFMGKFTDDKLDFERIELDNDFSFNVLTFPTAGGSPTQIYTANTDISDFNDIDNDGDMDILAFNSNGGHIHFYQNISIELGFGTDSLHFKLIDDCWGRLFEADMSEMITLGADPGDCPNGFDTPSDRHQGSTLLSFDEDGDGDREIVIGDVANEYLFKLTNGGDEDIAFMIDQDNEWPGYDSSVFIPSFPACYYLDLNNDGLEDFIASPNLQGATPDQEVVRFYKNVGTSDEAVFNFQQSDFLVNEMLDLGTNAYPVFEDVNADSLLDLVVGNFTIFRMDGNFDPFLFLFLNVGTATEPKFELTDANWLEINPLASDPINGSWGFAPTFGDLDNDGDNDLLVGERNGRLIYLENNAGKGNPMTFEPPITFWQGIDIGQNATPQIKDMNRDGLKDLVLGERRGHMVFFPNIGTASEPLFKSDHFEAPNINPFGMVDIDNSAGVGNITPIVLDYGDEFTIIMGWENNRLHIFDGIEGNLEGEFVLTDNNYGEIREGNNTAPALGDIDNDGLLEMVVGNKRGGLGFFETELPNETVISSIGKVLTPSLNVFPNPSTGSLTVQVKNISINSSKCFIFNALGQLVFEQPISDMISTLNLNHLTNGIYFCQVKTIHGSSIQKFVKK